MHGVRPRRAEARTAAGAAGQGERGEDRDGRADEAVGLRRERVGPTTAGSGASRRANGVRSDRRERRRQGLQWKSERSGDWNGKPGREAGTPKSLRTGTGTIDRHGHRHHQHHGRRRHPHHRRDHRRRDRHRHHRRRHRSASSKLGGRGDVVHTAVRTGEVTGESTAAGTRVYELMARAPGIAKRRRYEMVHGESGGAAAEPGAAGVGRREGGPCGGASLRRKERTRATPPPERRGPRWAAVRPASPGCRASRPCRRGCR